MGAGSGKTKRVQAAQGSYEAQRAAFAARIDEACENDDEQALEQVLDEIGQAAESELKYLEENGQDDEVLTASLAWASIANEAMQRFYMG